MKRQPYHHNHDDHDVGLVSSVPVSPARAAAPPAENNRDTMGRDVGYGLLPSGWSQPISVIRFIALAAASHFAAVYPARFVSLSSASVILAAATRSKLTGCESIILVRDLWQSSQPVRVLFANKFKESLRR